MPEDSTKKPVDMFKSLRDKAVDKAMPDEVPEYRLGESVDPAFTEREARKAARPGVQAGRYKENYPDHPPGRRNSVLVDMEDHADPEVFSSETQMWATRDHLAKIFEKKNGPVSPEDLSLGDWEALKHSPVMATEFYNKGLLGAGFYGHISSWMKDAGVSPINMPQEDDTWQTKTERWKAQEAFEKRRDE